MSSELDKSSIRYLINKNQRMTWETIILEQPTNQTILSFRRKDNSRSVFKLTLLALLAKQLTCGFLKHLSSGSATD